MAMTETTIELVLQLELAGVPFALRGSLKDGKLESLSGLVRIEKGLKEFLEALGADFSEAREVLKQLTGGTDIKLDSLAVGYHNREPTFCQVAATFTAGKSLCRFVLLKSMGTTSPGKKGGFAAGLELQLDETLFNNNPFVGLVGQISLGNLGLYYSSDAFQNVEYGQNVQPADKLNLSAEPNLSPIKSRDFSKGMNWSAEILVRGINLLDWSGIKGQKKSDPEGAQAQPGGGPPKETAELPRLTASTFWMNLNKSLGPLSVRRVGLSYEAPRVGIKFDASLQLAVLTFSLEGFGLSYPLDKFSDLKTDPLKFFDHVQFQLDGAAVAFEQGPLTISGGVLKVQKPYLQLDGALLIRAPGISISAIASYADLSGTPSFFAFAALLRELGDPTATGFFFVTGLAFGFGVNRALKLPTINEVQDFPLIKAATDEKYLGGKLDLRGISQKLGEYIFPSIGNFWVAAGVRFTSYGQIDSFALLSVSFGTRLEIALLGISRIQLPKPPAPVLASVELAIRVVVAPESGLLSVEARLTENSYLLSQDFKLRGGFAFYTWFAGEHAGDFVVSLGGYHPRFLPPAHYPRPDLVQFYCKQGDVTLQGSCYFALCPSFIMAGVGLSLVYQSGGIKAWFVAYAHFLLGWKPLHYDVEIAILVGVSLTLGGDDARTTLSVELGAAINLYGPPLGGIARISLGVVTFTARFGEDKSVPPPLLWESNDPEKSFAKSFLSNPAVTRILIADGLLEEVQHGGKTFRFVNPHGLTITCLTQAPATALLYNGSEPTGIQGVKVNRQAPGVQPWWNPKVGVRPMEKSHCYSLLEVTLAPQGGGGGSGAAAYMNQHVEISLTTGKVPRALWADDKLNPDVPSSNQMVEDALVGLQIRTKEGPRPWETPALDLKVLSYDRYAKSCPFAAVDAGAELPDPGEKTISATIAAAKVAEKRKEILEVLRRSGRHIMKREEIQVRQLQENAEYIFQASPVMARPGQYPPRGYLEV